MEGFFSEWAEFHFCVLDGDCNIFDISLAHLFTDLAFIVFAVVGQFAIYRNPRLRQMLWRLRGPWSSP